MHTTSSAKQKGEGGAGRGRRANKRATHEYDGMHLQLLQIVGVGVSEILEPWLLLLQALNRLPKVRVVGIAHVSIIYSFYIF